MVKRDNLHLILDQLEPQRSIRTHFKQNPLNIQEPKKLKFPFSLQPLTPLQHNPHKGNNWGV